MNTIYKYQIPVTDEQTLRLPLGAKILSCGNQFENLCIWALIDKSQKNTEDKIIRIYGTGHDIPNLFQSFLGTVIFDQGRLIFHVFIKD